MAPHSQFRNAALIRRSVASLTRWLLCVASAILILSGIAAAQASSGALYKLLNPAAKQNNAATKDAAKPDDNAAAGQPQSAPATSTPIPLPDVAARSQYLMQTLQAISTSLPDQQQVDDLGAQITARDQTLTDKRAEVDSLLNGTPTSLEIREQESYWRGMQTYTAEWRRQLLDWANSAQAAVTQLDVQEPQWEATLAAEQSAPGLGPVLDLIHENLSSLRKLRVQAQNNLRQDVNLQIRVTAQDQLVADVMNRLNKARVKLKGHMTDRDSLPLWQVAMRRQVGESPGMFQSTAARWKAIVAFVSEERVAIIILATLWIIATITAYRLKQVYVRARSDVDVDVDDDRAKAREMLRHWFALGLLVPLLYGYVLAPYAPLALIGLAVLVSFVPILTLLPPLIAPRLRVLLYYIVALYVFNATVAWFTFSPVHKREAQFLVALVMVAVFAWLVRPSRLAKVQVEGRLKVLVLGMRVAVVVFSISLLANLFGYLKLAQFLAVACIYSLFMAISIFTGVRVFCVLLTAGLESDAAERLAMVRQYRPLLARWLPRLVRIAGFLLWLMATLDLLSIRESIVDWFSSVLNFNIAGTSGDVTLGSVLGFFLILIVGYALSGILRFVLREEVLARFHMSRGMPELISTSLHYLILLFVFMAAIKTGGVELNKFTLITGALGVGVGFGLQNIINNFVSGLILQFERPIHIGDVLELEVGVAGTVTRIGIRSSTILTAQGAEIIVPNSNFISNRVTNWTLTEAERRVEIPIGVAYGSDVKLTMQLLNDAAAMHPDVLTQPPPVVYFKEFADSSLNFELQLWVMIQSNWVRVRSEVLFAVLQSLDKAGIEVPFPQRDLRLRSVDPVAAEMLSRNGTGTGDESSTEPTRDFAISPEIRRKHTTFSE